ncbi:STAS domain-containing protein [Niallia sp. JL1B1071]|uniref:STAS domain-containing protein n=1 Tax=Niallia tiangongensis TaxID=3237105 RepID=UPI0037DC01E8
MSTLIKHLSTPVMPVMQGIIAIISLIVKFNDERFEDLLQKGLKEFSERRASFLLLYLTGISEFDSFIIFRLQGLVKAIELIGGECVLVGIKHANYLFWCRFKTYSNICDIGTRHPIRH